MLRHEEALAAIRTRRARVPAHYEVPPHLVAWQPAPALCIEARDDSKVARPLVRSNLGNGACHVAPVAVVAAADGEAVHHCSHHAVRLRVLPRHDTATQRARGLVRECCGEARFAEAVLLRALHGIAHNQATHGAAKKLIWWLHKPLLIPPRDWLIIIIVLLFAIKRVVIVIIIVIVINVVAITSSSAPLLFVLVVLHNHSTLVPMRVWLIPLHSKTGG